MRYLIQLAYKGTNYHGWQRQENAQSVQQVLDEKISILLGEAIETLGCGRTDTGVHALQYFAHFDCNKPLERDQFLYKINQILPDDIAVYQMWQVAPDMNARFDATHRAYEYVINTIVDPFLTELSWYYYGKLDLKKMNEAAALLIGTHDFACFSKVHTQVNNFVCTVYQAEWRVEGHKLIFYIKANRFLRNMVRAIVGTLHDVGKGKLDVAAVASIMASKDRCEAGQSVPAKGLFLVEIAYPNSVFQFHKIQS